MIILIDLYRSYVRLFYALSGWVILNDVLVSYVKRDGYVVDSSMIIILFNLNANSTIISNELFYSKAKLM